MHLTYFFLRRYIDALIYRFFFFFFTREKNKTGKKPNEANKNKPLGKKIPQASFLSRSFISTGADKWIDNSGSDEAPILAKIISALVSLPQGVNDSNIAEAYHVLYVLDECNINVIILS